MNQNPYSSPDSTLDESDMLVIPDEVKKKIKNAWIAGLISITITVAITLISVSGDDIMGLNYTSFIDVAFMVVFTFGIYKNSRACAILMLLLFLLNKIIMFIQAGTASGLPLALVFLWYYTQGVIGTFQYHNHIKNSLNKSIQPTAEASAD